MIKIVRIINKIRMNKKDFLTISKNRQKILKITLTNVKNIKIKNNTWVKILIQVKF